LVRPVAIIRRSSRSVVGRKIGLVFFRRRLCGQSVRVDLTVCF
jgi:hypothetical protein